MAQHAIAAQTSPHLHCLFDVSLQAGMVVQKQQQVCTQPLAGHAAGWARQCHAAASHPSLHHWRRTKVVQFQEHPSDLCSPPFRLRVAGGCGGRQGCVISSWLAACGASAWEARGHAPPKNPTAMQSSTLALHCHQPAPPSRACDAQPPPWHIWSHPTLSPNICPS